MVSATTTAMSGLRVMRCLSSLRSWLHSRLGSQGRRCQWCGVLHHSRGNTPRFVSTRRVVHALELRFPCVGSESTAAERVEARVGLVCPRVGVGSGRRGLSHRLLLWRLLESSLRGESVRLEATLLLVVLTVHLNGGAAQ